VRDAINIRHSKTRVPFHIIQFYHDLVVDFIESSEQPVHVFARDIDVFANELRRPFEQRASDEFDDASLELMLNIVETSVRHFVRTGVSLHKVSSQPTLE
jgi:hypothetical protein